jgi:hypothetical protein
LTPLSRESNDWLDYKVYQAFNQIDTNHICVIVPKLSASEHSLGKTTMTAFSDAENGMQTKGSQEPNYPYSLAKRRKVGSGTKAKRRDGC